MKTQKTAGLVLLSAVSIMALMAFAPAVMADEAPASGQEQASSDQTGGDAGASDGSTATEDQPPATDDGNGDPSDGGLIAIDPPIVIDPVVVDGPVVLDDPQGDPGDIVVDNMASGGHKIVQHSGSSDHSASGPRTCALQAGTGHYTCSPNVRSK